MPWGAQGLPGGLRYLSLDLLVAETINFGVWQGLHLPGFWAGLETVWRGCFLYQKATFQDTVTHS